MTLLRRLRTDLYVQYGLICLYGSNRLEIRADEPDYHLNATFHLEAWDAEPPPPEGCWTLVEEGNLTAETGVVQVGVFEDSGPDFLIGPPWFEYGLSVHLGDPDITQWLLRFWPLRDVFDPVVHARPRETDALPPPEPRPANVPVTTAGQWAAMRPNRHVDWPATQPEITSVYDMIRLQAVPVDRVAVTLNPDRANTFHLGSDALHSGSPGGSHRVWRWEWETADGVPEDGNLRVGRIVHARDTTARRVFVSGIVTVLAGTGPYTVRDAQPHEAARVLCAEEVWHPRERTGE
ncbi:hypothetical protein FDA94_33545 [Herbidospora galbida]|uniref:Uncharacterized protein n=1 Tax=Herbidospora galbida TaxID=2575442 RepID=A0A4U3LY31_9ACTN|nr:hypothetical protein [Herbidospora galbida]TKK81195.1 hypothetical protein FDA94_33545 [Herbidospora galbida]